MNPYDDEDELESSGFQTSRNEVNELFKSSKNASSNDVTKHTEYYGDAYYYDDYYEDEYYKLLIFPFETKLLGIVRPAFIFLTVLSNTFVVQFFLCMKNRRKASNLLFVSIALSDTMTGIALLPNSLYVFASHRVFLSKTWCMIFMSSRLIVSRMFHTVSVWQTVILAIQRHLCVSHPFISSRFCTFWKTFTSIVVVYILAFCLHVYHFFNKKATYGECVWRIEENCHISCIYLWASVILQNLLPSLVLLLLTISTLRSLNKASSRISVMSGSQVGSTVRTSRDRIITITAVLIVIMFLIPELPHGIYMTILVTTLPRDQLVTQEQNHFVIAIYEVALTVTFHVNFWIYCSTMSDFRNAFMYFITCGRRQYHNKAHSKCSRTSSARSVRSSVSRTSSSTSRNRILSQSTSVMSTSSDTYIHPVDSSSETRKRPVPADGLYLGPVAENAQSKPQTVPNQYGTEIKYLPHNESQKQQGAILEESNPGHDILQENNDVFM